MMRRKARPKRWSSQHIIYILLLFVLGACLITVFSALHVVKKHEEQKVKPTVKISRASKPKALSRREEERQSLDKSQKQVQLPRLLAIYFPQFHQDPLNDRLWGEKFTDWDNLRKSPAKNRFGFAIPRPKEYYDLRDVTVRKRHGELAQQYGVDGFVYHHYWFYDPQHPGPTLHAPLIDMLRDGHPNLPFCLHWCEAHWAAVWHAGIGSKINATKGEFIQRQYWPEPDDPSVEEHYKWLKQFFDHPNYIKVQGQPVFMVYMWFKPLGRILERFRELAIADGYPGLYFTVGMSFTHDHLFPAGVNKGQLRSYPRFNGLINKTTAYPYPHEWMEGQTLSVPEWCGDKKHSKPTWVPGVMSSFDNTPRRSFEEAHIWSADEPSAVVDRFRKSLLAATYYESCCFGPADDDSLVVINAWNEWAEGMALEPSDVFGTQLLEAFTDVKQKVAASQCKAAPTI